MAFLLTISYNEDKGGGISMKKSKKNYIVIALIVLLLALGVGYAAFSQNLIITGSAKADAEFDVHFSAASIGASRGTATISEDKYTVTISGVELKYPGDSVSGSVTIENSSTVPVELTSVNVVDNKGNTLTGTYVQITGLNVATGEVIAANGGTNVKNFTISWPASATSDTSVDETLTFTITYTYTQNP